MTSPPRPVHATALTGVLALVAGGLLVLAGPPAAAAPQVRWTDTSVVLGGKARAVVSPGSRPKGTRLVLQRKVLDGWRTVDGAARRTERGFVLAVPTRQIGTFGYRVAAKDRGRVRATSQVRDVRVRPAYSPAGKRSDHTTLGNRRFRWDSCTTITWAFNPDSAPRDALRQVRGTIRRAREATGLRLKYAGRTRETPRLAPHRGGYRIIVGWRSPRSFRYFRVHPGRVGVGGASWRSGFREADGTRVDKAWSGRLILNARYGDDLRRGYGRGYTWGDVVLHEFGHVLGLGHARGPQQVMYPQLTKRKARWGAGDLAGLRRLGSARGCLDRAGGRAGGRADGRAQGHERAGSAAGPTTWNG